MYRPNRIGCYPFVQPDLYFYNHVSGSVTTGTSSALEVNLHNSLVHIDVGKFIFRKTGSGSFSLSSGKTLAIGVALNGLARNVADLINVVGVCHFKGSDVVCYPFIGRLKAAIATHASTVFLPNTCEEFDYLPLSSAWNSSDNSSVSVNTTVINDYFGTPSSTHPLVAGFVLQNFTTSLSRVSSLLMDISMHRYTNDIDIYEPVKA